MLLYTDSSDAAGAADVGRVRAVLGHHASEIARLRLMARGIDPTVLSAIAVQDVDVATPTSRSVLILGTLTVIILMTMLMGGLHIVAGCHGGRTRARFAGTAADRSGAARTADLRQDPGRLRVHAPVPDPECLRHGADAALRGTGTAGHESEHERASRRGTHCLLARRWRRSAHR